MSDSAAALPREPLPGRAAALLAALSAGLSVGLGAYAAHAAGQDGERLSLAALYLMFHALGVLALLGRRGRMIDWSRWLLLGGAWLFSGTLTGVALAGWPAASAPVGGVSMMLGWLLLALALLRREGARP